jgi:hypothetical protein
LAVAPAAPAATIALALPPIHTAVTIEGNGATISRGTSGDVHEHDRTALCGR